MQYKRILDSDLEISDNGKLRNIKTKKEYAIFKNQKTGYLKCNDSVINKRKLPTSNIHRLMYFTFNESWSKYDDCLYVDHIDRDKTNNSLNNLRLVTPTVSSLNRGKYSVKVFYNIITKEKILTDNIMSFAKKINHRDNHFYDLINKKKRCYNNWVGCIVEYNTNDMNFVIDISSTENYDNDIKDLIEKTTEKRKRIDGKSLIKAKNKNNNKIYLFHYCNKKIFCIMNNIEEKRISEYIHNNYFHKGYKFEIIDSIIELKDSIIEFENENMFNDYLERE